MCRKEQGAALVGALRATGGKLFLPEILKHECFEQTQKMVDENFLKLQKHASVLKPLVNLPELSPPQPGSVGQSVQRRFDQLQNVTLEGPSVDDLLKASGRRTIANRPPSTKTDHGYKDCMIFEAILTLPEGTNVWLASDDGGFFVGQTAELLQELREDAKARGIKIQGARTLQPIVDELAKVAGGLDVAELERRELQELGNTTPDAVPPAPVTADLKGSDNDISPVQAALAASEKVFDGLDLKVLGYIAYLDPVSKVDLYDALLNADIPMDVAKNVVDRLVLNGLVRDSGSNYLIADRSLQEAAAATVEKEIIRLLEAKRGANG